MSTYRNVKAQIAKLEKQASDLFKKEVQVVIGKVRGLISEYGLTAADLGLTGKVSKSATTTRKKKSVAAKPVGIPVYADPASGKTWTGKGKPPNWIVEGVKKGKSRNDFLISTSAAAPVVETKASKPSKTVKVAKTPKATKKPATSPKAVKKLVRKVAAKKVAAKATVAKAVVAKA